MKKKQPNFLLVWTMIMWGLVISQDSRGYLLGFYKHQNLFTTEAEAYSYTNNTEAFEWKRALVNDLSQWMTIYTTLKKMLKFVTKINSFNFQETKLTKSMETNYVSFATITISDCWKVREILVPNSEYFFKNRFDIETRSNRQESDSKCVVI